MRVEYDTIGFMNIWKTILKRWRCLVTACGIVATLLLGFVIVAYIVISHQMANFGSWLEFGCKVDEPGGIEQTEALGQFDFPPGAVNMSARCSGMQGWWLEASFDMPSAELGIFQSSTEVVSAQWMTSLPPADSIQPYSLPTRDLFTWSEGMQSLLYGAYSVNEFSQEILIDTSNPTLFRVKILVLGG